MSYNKTEIPICGQMGVDVKVTGFKGTGSLGMRKVNSRMGQVIGKAIRDGPVRYYQTSSIITCPFNFKLIFIDLQLMHNHHAILLVLNSRADAPRRHPLAGAALLFDRYCSRGDSAGLSSGAGGEGNACYRAALS